MKIMESIEFHGFHGIPLESMENRFWKSVFGKPSLENSFWKIVLGKPFLKKPFLENRFWKTVFEKTIVGSMLDRWSDSGAKSLLIN